VVDCHDARASVLSFLRFAADPQQPPVLVVCNCTPMVRENYRLGVPRGGLWRERLNSDARDYGGSGQGNLGALEAAPLPAHGHHHSLSLRLPPLATLFLRPD
jgi:1,4-alpha-glucan branching enzyme